MLQKVLEHLRTQGVHRREIAKSVHLTVDDFDRLVFGLVLLAQEGGNQGPSTRSGRDHLRLIER